MDERVGRKVVASVGMGGSLVQPDGLGALGLLAELHGKRVRLLSASAGRDFQGLQQAAAWLRKRGSGHHRGQAAARQCRATCKRLCNLEVALKFAAHITGPRANAFSTELEEELKSQAEQPDVTAAAASTSYEESLSKSIRL